MALSVVVMFGLLVAEAAAEPTSTRRSDNAVTSPSYSVTASLALTKRPRPLTAACHRSSSLDGSSLSLFGGTGQLQVAFAVCQAQPVLPVRML